ncbi:hypothetical protein DAPPUDRAFT_247280 [Daphnia pulex]|uniref:Uncharacterized protein n=1 Tax=Daphnia pulex TaxID=6669 RepID=E9GS55_DAPPU|nr:hypothetical protein DAPPUDRAFT_247280 [Daphnia pulex]|eukprot:EFX77653.1 hypothetical protein DAPPUDRAFT_247280 [Daphnia pulex]
MPLSPTSSSLDTVSYIVRDQCGQLQHSSSRISQRINGLIYELIMVFFGVQFMFRSLCGDDVNINILHADCYQEVEK